MKEYTLTLIFNDPSKAINHINSMEEVLSKNSLYSINTTTFLGPNNIYTVIQQIYNTHDSSISN